MTTKLEPCPVCGKPHIIFTVISTTSDNIVYQEAYCAKCHSSIRMYVLSRRKRIFEIYSK